MADGTAWRLVSQCATVEDLVRVFRSLASADGLERIPVSGIGPGGGSTVRLVLALSSKAAALDGDALVTRDAGTVSVKWLSLDARGKGLLAHMVEHRAAPSPPAVPRHLVPLGAAAGSPASARGDASMAKCVFEPMGVGGMAPRGGASVPDLASTVRMPGSRQPAPPTIRDSALPAAAAPAEKPKREVQKTLMGMPTLSAATRSKPASIPPGVVAPGAPVSAGSAPVSAVPGPVARTRSAPRHAATPAVIGPQPSSGATTTPVVAMGTPPVGLAESAPVPMGAVEPRETGPTQPTRGAGVASRELAAAARAIAATPVAAFDHAPTVPTAAPRRAEAAPSGPVEDAPTVPNEDVVTDVSVALPDLPAGDYVDPIVEPPVLPPAAPAAYVAAAPSPGWPAAAYPPASPMVMPAVPAQPYYPTPYPAQPGIAPMLVERDDDMTEMVQLMRPGARSRWPVIAVTSGVIVIGVAVMVVFAARGGGGDGGGGKANAPPAPAVTPPASGGAAAAAAVAPSAPEQPEQPEQPAPPASCKVAFTSSPDAAEVVLDGSVIGTTPFEHEGSCAAYQVTFRRDKYASLTEEVAAGATSLDVRLERPPFKVRVTSRPSGAVVKVGGENLGKTPVTITLPGFETTSIELVRGGKTTPHRVYAGKSGQKVHVKLRRR